MTDEEIKAYAEMIEKTSLDDLEKFMDVLPNHNMYNLDIVMGKICEVLAENINILRRLNSENEKHELDDEILVLLKKYFICAHYLDNQSEIVDDENTNGYRVVFAKTPTGKPYFMADLSKISIEAYDEVKKTLESILNGVNMSDDTQVKYFTGANLPQKVLEFKGFQVRIFTTKLKGNILCVFGLKIKKDDNPKSIKKFLEDRLTFVNKPIKDYRNAMNNPEQKRELLLDSKDILDDIMDVLNGGAISDDGDILFPSDEELQDLVPFEMSNNTGETGTLNDGTMGVYEEVYKSKDVIPITSKKVKRRTRGLGKKTIARNEITASLKGLNLEDLMKIKDFIAVIRMNKEADERLSDTIENIYEGFLNMSDEQVRKFEKSIGNGNRRRR